MIRGGFPEELIQELIVENEIVLMLELFRSDVPWIILTFLIGPRQKLTHT